MPSTGTGKKPRMPGGPPAAGHRTFPAWICPRSNFPELADADTIGVIYDGTDGLNFCNEYGMLRELFADLALTSDEGTRTCCAGTCGRRRSARCRSAAHPQTAGAVFRKILGQPHFSWAEDGEALLRWRKPGTTSTSPVPTSL